MNLDLKNENIRRILVRGTNWVGDAIMTTPALAALKGNFPAADITVLAKPWVAPVYAHHPAVSRVMVFDKETKHRGLFGLLRLAREVRAERFDLAVLFQNAVEAALIAWLARTPRRLGYNTDGRGLLLNRKVRLRPEDKRVHETEYYLRILSGAGLDAPWTRPAFHPSPEAERRADEFLRENGLEKSFRLGLAPGAAYGTAKQWPAERFAAAADLVIREKGGAALVFGSRSEAETAGRTKAAMEAPAFDLSGQTDLTLAGALIKRCHLFFTNDSGLMHLAAAVDAPLVAVFGSTNPVTTRPAAGRFAMVRHEVDCAPCLKPVCTQPTHRCMELVQPDEVAETGLKLLAETDESPGPPA